MAPTLSYGVGRSSKWKILYTLDQLYGEGHPILSIDTEAYPLIDKP